jgi:hypothetical protein
MQKVRLLLVLASLVASTVVLPLTQSASPALAAPPCCTDPYVQD